MIHICKNVRFAICAGVLLAAPCIAQSGSDGTDQAPQAAQPAAPQPPAAQQTNVPPSTPPSEDVAPLPPRFSAGFRVEDYPQRMFQTQQATSTTTNPITSSAYFATAAGSRIGLGVTAEYRLTRKISIGVDFFYHQWEFTQLTQIKSGLPNPNSSYDNRPLTSVTSDTRADYTDLPVVARYYGLHQKNPRGFGFLKDSFVLGGIAYRHVGNIRTGTATSLADTETAYIETPAVPVHTNLIGVVAGVGYKLFEYNKFKSMVEGRYTRWFGYTFQGPAYESTRNQFELGLTFSY
jgi:hypothetical protein